MSKKIISFTLLSTYIFLSAFTIEAMRFKNFARVRMPISRKHFILPAGMALTSAYLFSKTEADCSEDTGPLEKPQKYSSEETFGILQKIAQGLQDFSLEDFSLLEALVKKPSNNSATKEKEDGLPHFNPESCLKKPNPETAKQKETHNYFEKFRKTYTGEVSIKVDILIQKIKDLKEGELGVDIIRDRDKACLKEANFINTLILYGEPGNGKSYLVEELARTMQIDVLYCTGSTLQSSYKHKSAENIRDLFDYAKKQDRPLIIFIDEVDPIAGKQVANNGNNHESTDCLRMTLDKIDEIKYQKNIYLIVGTNHLYWLEKAFLSRFASKIEIQRPKTLDDYKAYFKYQYCEQHALGSVADSEILAKRVYAEIPESRNFVTSRLYKTGDTYSRRNLMNFIPLIQAIKAVDYAKRGLDTPELKAETKKINFKTDEAYIVDALKILHDEYISENMEAPLSKEMQIIQNTQRHG